MEDTMKECPDCGSQFDGETSDGYHTFDELYEHRNLLFIALCLHNREHCRWAPHYPGWPVLFLELNGVQISYHVQEKYLPLFEEKIQRDDKYKWDGHEAKDVLERLLAFNERAYKRKFGGGVQWEPGTDRGPR